MLEAVLPDCLLYDGLADCTRLLEATAKKRNREEEPGRCSYYRVLRSITNVREKYRRQLIPLGGEVTSFLSWEFRGRASPVDDMVI